MEDYERLWQIGSGGQGRVHKVKNKKSGKYYALKQILCRDSHEMNFALHEIKVLTNVKHENIIGFHDFFVHKDRMQQQYSICLSMELCECGDFSDRIKDARRKRVKFDESRIRKWIVQMCAAMNYLHEQDYIHRDIKPTNIFFTADDCVRLGDFGLSRRCEDAGRKTIVGTPYYFAPELLLRQRYTNKVDLWGLGIVILELCTLRERPINTQLLQGDRVLTEVEHEFLARGYSQKMASLCTSLMAKDPRQRPSAREVFVKWASDSEKEHYGFTNSGNLRQRSKSGGPQMAVALRTELQQQQQEHNVLVQKLADKDDELKRLKHELLKLKEEKGNDKAERAPLQPLPNGNNHHKVAAGKPTAMPRFPANRAVNVKGFVPISEDVANHPKAADKPDKADKLEPAAAADKANTRKVESGSSIQHAIDAASSGDIIRIEAGTYSRPLNVNKAVTLTAANPDNRPVLEVEDRSVLTISAAAEISHLVIKQRKSSGGEGKWVAADFRSSTAVMHHCDLSSHGGACITVHKSAEPHIHHCQIHDGAQAGVYLFDGAKGLLESNDIYNNTYAAVLLKRGAQPVIKNNKIHDGRDTGVFICHDSKGTIIGNEIYDNGGSGIVVKAGGSPMIEKNHIHSNRQAGVFLCDRGSGTVKDNDITNNVKAGVLIKTLANPLVQGNTIRGGKETGVYCFENGKGTIRENKITANQNAGVLVTSGGHLVIEKNSIHSNKYEGVWVCNAGEAHIVGNDLKGNMKGALDIDESCKANVVLKDNIV
ncbi:F-box protein dre-1 [Diplonema papillatum]|nr:F-box protein dre-1 [Diplonema papillatum]